jgi:cytochrome P450
MATAVLPPGPRGHLLAGNFPELKKDRLAFLTRIAREYGDVVALRFGPKQIVILSHPDHIEYVLVTANRKFSKDFSIRMYRPVLGNGLLLSEGDFWLRQRRLSQPAFQKGKIAAYGETMVGFTERMLAQWQDGQNCDVHAELMRLTLAIAAKTFFDADLTNEGDNVGKALEEALVSIDKKLGAFYWLPGWVPTPTNRRLKGAVARLDQILYGLISQRRVSGQDRGDLLSLLFHARDEDDGSRMTDKQLRDEAMTLLLAGHETTALALSWAWYLLAQHPSVVEELERELQTVLGGRSPTVADLPSLPFTERVVTEAMRLYPPAYGMGREVVEECDIGEYHVPVGTTIFFHQWVVHRDPRWYDEPEKFRPNRWADGLAQRIPKYAYFPFGGGPRLCIGNQFAMMEAVLVLATMAQQFRMQLEPCHEVTLWPSITLRPRNGIRVRLKRR